MAYRTPDSRRSGTKALLLATLGHRLRTDVAKRSREGTHSHLIAVQLITTNYHIKEIFTEFIERIGLWVRQ